MRSYAPILLTTLVLVACQGQVTTSATDPLVPPSPETTFTGTHTTIDLQKSSIAFIGKSSIVDHPGVFQHFTATLTPDSAAPADFTKAAMRVTIDLKSVKTDSEGLDGHMQKSDFFNTEVYPEATFVSTKVDSLGGNRYAITGDLTMKGMTKSVTAQATVTDGGLTATFDIPRQEYKVANDSYKDKLLDAQVPVTVQFVFQA